MMWPSYIMMRRLPYLMASLHVVVIIIVVRWFFFHDLGREGTAP